MLSNWWRRSSFRYTAVPTTSKEYETHQVQRRRTPSWLSTLLSALLLVVISGGVGYHLGNREHAEYRSGLLAPAGTTERQFVYNRSYAAAPTNDTADLWDSLFPKNGGFIHHPVLATNFSGVAVFHQLHCLHALYNLYYNTSSHHHKRGEDHSVHARHCFDYLRQTLMCHADTNLEPYNYRLDGVTGWGTKQCRDYDAVVKFVGEWGGSKFAHERIDDSTEAT